MTGLGQARESLARPPQSLDDQNDDRIQYSRECRASRSTTPQRARWLGPRWSWRARPGVRWMGMSAASPPPQLAPTRPVLGAGAAGGERGRRQGGGRVQAVAGLSVWRSGPVVAHVQAGGSASRVSRPRCLLFRSCYRCFSCRLGLLATSKNRAIYQGTLGSVGACRCNGRMDGWMDGSGRMAMRMKKS